MSPRTPSADFQAGVRTCVAWLHERARSMHDPHAAAILNTAAFHLGQDKPTREPRPALGEGDVEWRVHAAYAWKFADLIPGIDGEVIQWRLAQALGLEDHDDPRPIDAIIAEANRRAGDGGGT
jgi:hypothetical protein